VSHLTESLLGALVDGDLRPGLLDDVVAHAAACPPCRERVEAERWTRCRLAAAGDLRPSEDLTARLLAMSAHGALRSSSDWPEASRAPWRGRRRMAWLGAVAVTGAAAVGGLYVLGGPVRPGLDPADIAMAAAQVPASSTVRAVAADSGAAAFVGAVDADADGTAAALAWMREEGWTTPAVVPATLVVSDLRYAPDGMLVMELAGQESLVTVLEWRGTLEDAVLSDAMPLELGGGDAYLVSTAPWTAVKQSGAVAVAVVCRGSLHAGRQVMAAIPYAEPGSGPVVRIARGWQALMATTARPAGR
jgi:hypothetical protein